MFIPKPSIVFLTSHDNNLITPIINTQLNHFFGKEHYRNLRPWPHLSIFYSIRFCLKQNRADVIVFLLFSTVLCPDIVFNGFSSSFSVFTCPYVETIRFQNVPL